MQVRLDPSLQDTPAARTAADIIGQCVHCGFCLPACATYQQLGDELDGPRGRIYLIKQLLEGTAGGEITRVHLDRCLGCRACESACPSGVRYGALLETGHALLEARSPRPAQRRLARWLLRRWLTGPWFAASVSVARRLRSLLPPALGRRLGPGNAAPWNDRTARPATAPARRVLLLAGCVQPALRPGIDAAATRLLAAVGIGIQVMPQAGCCGAIDQHLDAPARALERARRNIDAWWPQLQAGAEALLVTASGCGAQVADYGRLLQGDAMYATRAAQVSARCRDLSQLLAGELATLRPQLAPARDERVAFQSPCTLQNGLRLGGSVETLLGQLGATLLPVPDGTLCCGSAGSYSLLHPELSTALRQRKLAALLGGQPGRILSANIGCIAHLAAESPVTVQHWAEWLAERLPADGL